jgi:hypothetical protein
LDDEFREVYFLEITFENFNRAKKRDSEIKSVVCNRMVDGMTSSEPLGWNI